MLFFAAWKSQTYAFINSKDKLNQISFWYTTRTHRFSMFIQLCSLLSLSLNPPSLVGTYSHAHTLLSHLQRLPKVMIINATRCNGSTLCYEFPLDNHFQCQIIQFIRTNNPSGLSIWMENAMWCALRCHSNQPHWTGLFVCTLSPTIHRRWKGKQTANTIQLWIQWKFHSIRHIINSQKRSLLRKMRSDSESVQFNLRFLAWLESNLYSN